MLLIPNCFIPSQFIVGPPPTLSESGLRFQGNQVPESLTQIKPDNFNTNLRQYQMKQHLYTKFIIHERIWWPAQYQGN